MGVCHLIGNCLLSQGGDDVGEFIEGVPHLRSGALEGAGTRSMVHEVAGKRRVGGQRGLSLNTQYHGRPVVCARLDGVARRARRG